MREQSRGVAVLSLVAAMATAAGGGASFRQAAPLARLAGTAYAIVAGSVVATRGDTFTLAVERRLGGEDVGREVVVAEPPRMPTEPRWAPYRRGQGLVLFLLRPPGNHDPATPRQIAGGADGELVFDARYLYLVGHFVDGLPLETHDVDGAPLAAQRLERTVVLDAFAAYPDCFAWRGAEHGRAPFPRRICDEARLAGYAARSPLHRLLVRQSATE